MRANTSSPEIKMSMLEYSALIFFSLFLSWTSCQEVKFFIEQVFVQGCKSPTFFSALSYLPLEVFTLLVILTINLSLIKKGFIWIWKIWDSVYICLCLYFMCFFPQFICHLIFKMWTFVKFLSELQKRSQEMKRN